MRRGHCSLLEGKRGYDSLLESDNRRQTSAGSDRLCKQESHDGRLRLVVEKWAWPLLKSRLGCGPLLERMRGYRRPVDETNGKRMAVDYGCLVECGHYLLLNLHVNVQLGRVLLIVRYDNEAWICPLT